MLVPWGGILALLSVAYFPVRVTNPRFGLGAQNARIEISRYRYVYNNNNHNNIATK